MAAEVAVSSGHGIPLPCKVLMHFQNHHVAACTGPLALPACASMVRNAGRAALGSACCVAVGAALAVPHAGHEALGRRGHPAATTSAAQPCDLSLGARQQCLRPQATISISVPLSPDDLRKGACQGLSMVRVRAGAYGAASMARQHACADPCPPGAPARRLRCGP